MQPLTPVWLLDVDGVLDAPTPPPPVRTGRVTLLGQHWERQWNDGVIDFVRRVHAEGLAEVRWASTWVRFGWIEELEQLWDLHLPRAFPADIPATAAKLPAALAVVELEQRPLVWTDDDAIPMTGDDHSRLTESGQPVLLLPPDPHHGLQQSDLHQIEQFLTKWTSQTWP